MKKFIFLLAAFAIFSNQTFAQKSSFLGKKPFEDSIKPASPNEPIEDAVKTVEDNIPTESQGAEPDALERTEENIIILDNPPLDGVIGGSFREEQVPTSEISVSSPQSLDINKEESQTPINDTPTEPMSSVIKEVPMPAVPVISDEGLTAQELKKDDILEESDDIEDEEDFEEEEEFEETEEEICPVETAQTVFELLTPEQQAYRQSHYAIPPIPEGFKLIKKKFIKVDKTIMKSYANSIPSFLLKGIAMQYKFTKSQTVEDKQRLLEKGFLTPGPYLLDLVYIFRKRTEDGYIYLFGVVVNRCIEKACSTKPFPCKNTAYFSAFEPLTGGKRHFIDFKIIMAPEGYMQCPVYNVQV